MAERGRLVVVTPWYPTQSQPYWGSFVRDTVHALDGEFDDVVVLHALRVDPGSSEPATITHDRGIEVRTVPVALEAAAPRAELARRTRDALVAHVDLLRSAVVVHVHVGMPTGWAVVDLVADDVPVVVTEHASYLNQVFAEPTSRAMYVETVERSRALLTVSEAMARALRIAVPGASERILTVSNPVDVARLEPRDRPPVALDRWLYVGNLLAAKGVLRLVDAFADWVTDHPDAHLTLVGDGVDRSDVEQAVQAAELADRVHFVGRVAPDEVVRYYRAADVLVHLSVSETFGLTALEAVATGLPVLATATGGAREILDVAQEQWMAWLVPTEPAPSDVRLGLERLTARLTSARADVVRADLTHRYGQDRVRRRLSHVLRTGGLPTEGPERFRAVVVALAPKTDRGARRVVTDVARYGGTAVLVTDRPSTAEDLDPAVRVIDVSDRLRRLPTHVLERALLGAPDFLLRQLGRFARHETHRARVRHLRRRYRKVAAFGRRVAHRLVHAHVDPVVVMRYVLDRHASDVADAHLVVWGDLPGLPLAARLAALSPDAEVVRTADNTLVTSLARSTGAARASV